MSARARGGDALAWAGLSLTPWKQEPATVKTLSMTRNVRSEMRVTMIPWQHAIALLYSTDLYTERGNLDLSSHDFCFLSFVEKDKLFYAPPIFLFDEIYSGLHLTKSRRELRLLRGSFWTRSINRQTEIRT